MLGNLLPMVHSYQFQPGSKKKVPETVLSSFVIQKYGEICQLILIKLSLKTYWKETRYKRKTRVHLSSVTQILSSPLPLMVHIYINFSLRGKGNVHI